MQIVCLFARRPAGGAFRQAYTSVHASYRESQLLTPVNQRRSSRHAIDFGRCVVGRSAGGVGLQAGRLHPISLLVHSFGLDGSVNEAKAGLVRGMGWLVRGTIVAIGCMAGVVDREVCVEWEATEGRRLVEESPLMREATAVLDGADLRYLGIDGARCSAQGGGACADGRDLDAAKWDVCMYLDASQVGCMCEYLAAMGSHGRVSCAIAAQDAAHCKWDVRVSCSHGRVSCSHGPKWAMVCIHVYACVSGVHACISCVRMCTSRDSIFIFAAQLRSASCCSAAYRDAAVCSFFSCRFSYVQTVDTPASNPFFRDHRAAALADILSPRAPPILPTIHPSPRYAFPHDTIRTYSPTTSVDSSVRSHIATGADTPTSTGQIQVSRCCRLAHVKSASACRMHTPT